MHRSDCFESGCEMAAGGTCLPDDCAVQNCGVAQGCRMGTCFATCLDVECDEGERCVGGMCAPDACAQVDCGDGLICRDASCEEDPCMAVRCSGGQTCLDGECVDDPCLTTRCPRGSECVMTPAGTPDCLSVEVDSPVMDTPRADMFVPGVAADAGINDESEQAAQTGTRSDGCQAAPMDSSSNGVWALFALLLLAPRVRRVALLAIIAMVGAGCGDEGENLKMIDVSDLSCRWSR